MLASLANSMRTLSRSRRGHRGGKSLASESLEPRLLLAGDVHASVWRGDLRIEGDNAANQIEIAPADGGGVQVVGLDGTRINGSEEPAVFFPGDDAVPDDLRISTRGGADSVFVRGIRVTDDLIVYAGSGDDRVEIDNVTAGDRIDLWPGSGNDFVQVVGRDSSTLPTARDILVYASSGDNIIGVNNVSVSRDIYIRSSRGNDVLLVQGSRAGDDMRLYGDTGDDIVAILDSEVTDDTTLQTGPASLFSLFSTAPDRDSALIMGSTHNGRADLTLGPGHDFLAVVNTSVRGRADVSAGSGDDRVGIERGDFGSSVQANGGQGTDGLLVTDSLFAEEPTVRSFENEPGQFQDQVDEILQQLTDAGILLPELESIAQIVAGNPEFSTLGAALETASLADTLDVDGTFTVFAPTNAAFDALPDGTLDVLLADPEGQLRDILLYHVADEALSAEDIVLLDSVDTLLGPSITVEIGPGGGVVLNGTVNVTATDIKASNGVIHVIDAVIIPPVLPTITELVVEDDLLSTLEAAVVAADLAETLDGEGTFTVFAPTNAAFDALPEGTLEALLADPEGQLKEVLFYHVAGEVLDSEDVAGLTSVPTLLGPPITVEVTDDGVLLNGSVQLVTTDIEASNGIVHVIDAVLLPPEGPTQSIAEIVADSEDFETLEVALNATGLTSTLAADGSFTVFAPTDDAFAKLSPFVLNLLVNFLPSVLENILLYHVADTVITSAEIVQLDSITTLNGRDISINVTDTGVVLNNRVNVTVTDIAATNGVIHVIDTVLFPF